MMANHQYQHRRGGRCHLLSSLAPQNKHDTSSLLTFPRTMQRHVRLQRRHVTNGTFLLVMAMIGCLPDVATGTIGDNGLCPLYIFVPFTDGGVARKPLSASLARGNPGFAFMASAWMAMEHFNTRNSTVIPELINWIDCPIQFDFNQSHVFDTGSMSHMASRAMLQREMEIVQANGMNMETSTSAGSVNMTGSPCALVGAFTDTPALELNVMALATEIPFVVHRSLNLRTVDTMFSPYSTQVFPDLKEMSSRLISYLNFKGRSNYIYVIVAMSDLGLQQREAISLALENAHMKWESALYLTNITNGPYFSADLMSIRSIPGIVKDIKERGFRTIVVAMFNPEEEFPMLADAAAQYGMNNGDYLWLWFGDFSADTLDQRSNNESIDKLLGGSGWLTVGERFLLTTAHPTNATGNNNNNNDTKFLRAWQAQDDDFWQRVNDAVPLSPGQPGYFQAPPNYTSFLPEWGSGYMYDAVMTAGIGACQATLNWTVNQTSTSSATRFPISSQLHLQGIRNVEFDGATGPIYFLSDPPRSAGSRAQSTATWGIINILPSGFYQEGDSQWTMSDMLVFDSPQWVVTVPFVYADGGTSPPALLRDVPQQNYLNPILRGIGIGLASLLIAVGALSIVWVYRHRTHRVIRAGQPSFLYVICFGSMVSASAIVSISFDDSYLTSEKTLDRLCNATAWLLCMGHMLTYGALFSKLWRVNRVLQFRRRRVDVKHIVVPFVLLCLAAIGLLTGLSVYDPLTFQRKETNAFTGESVCHCTSSSMLEFYIPLIVVMLIPTVLTGVMAYKTKDVDDVYSESGWILMLFLVQLEVILIAVPLVVILRDLSTDGRYFGLAVLVWTLPASTLGFIIFPKVTAFYAALKSSQAVHKRGEACGGTRISGLVMPSGEARYGSTGASESRIAVEGTEPSKAFDAKETVVVSEESAANEAHLGNEGSKAKELRQESAVANPERPEIASL